MNIATDTHGIVYLIDVPASVGVRSCGQCSMSLRNAYTQTRNVQTQTQSTVCTPRARACARAYVCSALPQYKNICSGIGPAAFWP